jgi:hypothetical protein
MAFYGLYRQLASELGSNVKLSMDIRLQRKKLIKSVYRCKLDRRGSLQDFCLQDCLKTL